MKFFKYIIKRILIGVGIALILGYLKGNLLMGVQAKEIGSIYNPFTTSNTAVVSNLDTQAVFNIRSGYFSNWGLSTVRFNFSVIKVSGEAVAPLVVPSGVALGNYVCDVSSTSVGNSTFTGSTYSAVCPVNLGSTGMGEVVVFLTPNQQNTSSNYRISVGMLFTAETNTDINLDTSGTTNAINNQISNDNTNTQNIINNQNINKQDLINNQNQNTQDIINNQNSNTDKEIKSQRVCSYIDKNSVVSTDSILGSTGYLQSYSGFGVTDYISISSDDTLEMLQNLSVNSPSAYFCFYNINKIPISGSCKPGINSSNIGIVSIPSDASYFKSTINISQNKPTFKLCRNGNQAITDATNNNTNAINNVNDTINNDNVDNANTEASDFFNNFQHDSHGLSGIITAPLRLINSFTTAQCTPLQFQLPFIHNQVTLPCMRGIYENYFGVFFSLYQLITTGLICYNVMINLYSKIRNLQNPNNDRIEVLNL